MRLRISSRFLPGILAIAGLTLAGGEALATSLASTNLVDLLRNSTSILKGEVTSVTDGVDPSGLPYTEVTLEVGQTLRGVETGTYSFRQFGLLAPRLSPDGTRLAMPAPDGLPKYEVGEKVLLFMSRPASQTGLRSTYALGNGKFTLGPGRAENAMGNQGLFTNVSLDASLTTSNDARMLQTEIGAVNDGDFVSLVERAVQGGWVENGLMWRTNEGRRSGGSTGTATVTVK